MGGAGGTPENPALKDPSGIGSSRAGLEAAAGAEPQKMFDQLPGWAAGDTMESWLTRLPGGDGGVSQPAATNAAPEGTATLGTLGAAPPVYGAGTGTRSEAGERAAVPMQGPGISGAAPAPASTNKADDWVYANIPTAYWHQGDAAITAGAQPGGNFNGVYMPQGLTRSNAANYMEPGTMATMGGQPLPQGQPKPGDPITGDPAASPRMRRGLYDFNMANYGNPFGPQGNPTPPMQPHPNSFFMGGGG